MQILDADIQRTGVSIIRTVGRDCTTFHIFLVEMRTDTDAVTTDRVISRSIIHTDAVRTVIPVVALQEAECDIHSATIRLRWVRTMSACVSETNIQVALHSVIAIQIRIAAARDDHGLIACVVWHIAAVHRTRVPVVTIPRLKTASRYGFIDTFLDAQVTGTNRTWIAVIAVWIEVDIALDALVIHTNFVIRTVRIVVVATLLQRCIRSNATLVSETDIQRTDVPSSQSESFTQQSGRRSCRRYTDWSLYRRSPLCSCFHRHSPGPRCSNYQFAWPRTDYRHIARWYRYSPRHNRSPRCIRTTSARIVLVGEQTVVPSHSWSGSETDSSQHRVGRTELAGVSNTDIIRAWISVVALRIRGARAEYLHLNDILGRRRPDWVGSSLLNQDSCQLVGSAFTLLNVKSTDSPEFLIPRSNPSR